MDFQNLEIAGIAIFLLIIGLVEAAKRFGIRDEWSFGLSLVLGLGFAALARALEQQLIPLPWVPWVEVGIVGLAGGLACTGLYDLTKRATGSR
jgi:hypothetical protein